MRLLASVEGGSWVLHQAVSDVEADKPSPFESQFDAATDIDSRQRVSCSQHTGERRRVDGDAENSFVDLVVGQHTGAGTREWTRPAKMWSHGDTEQRLLARQHEGRREFGAWRVVAVLGFDSHQGARVPGEPSADAQISVIELPRFGHSNLN